MPSIIAPSMKAIMPVRIIASVSRPAAFMPSTSSKLKPYRRSITKMRRDTSEGCGRGTMYPVWLRRCNMRDTSTMFDASMRKSSSSTMVSAKSSTSAGGLASAAILMRPMRNGASQAMTRRSLRTSLPIFGRCTLTTTDSPVVRVAA